MEENKEHGNELPGAGEYSKPIISNDYDECPMDGEIGSVDLTKDKYPLSNAKDKTHKGRFVNKNDLSSTSGSPSEREVEQK